VTFSSLPFEAVTVVRTGSGCRTWLNSSEKPQPIKMATKAPVQGAAGFDVTPSLLDSSRKGLRSVPSPIKSEDGAKGKDKDKDNKESGEAFEMTPIRRTNVVNCVNNGVVEEKPEKGIETKL
jgi:hypothetical protein